MTETPRDYIASSHVGLRPEPGLWRLAAPAQAVILDARSLAVHMEGERGGWQLLPAGGGDMLVRRAGVDVWLDFAEARHRETRQEDWGACRGLSLRLGGFQKEGVDYDLQIVLFIGVDWLNGDVLFQVRPIEMETKLRECYWPKAFAPEAVEHTVIPFMQGILVPRDWPHAIFAYGENGNREVAATYGRTLYMPWWGVERGDSAAMLILETPDDGGCRLRHPPGGPTRVETRWLHSLGELRYPRQARLCFVKPGNYVSLAKRYRQYVQERGRFVSLREKLARSPHMTKMVGAPVINTRALTHVQPESSFFNRADPAMNHRLQTFAQIAEKLRVLSARGVKQAYVHLDGFGFRGYDNLEPDVLPPSPEAGGWAGLRDLALTCAELGYLLALHQQFRDLYCDGASFDPRRAIRLEDRTYPVDSTWDGGRATVLCPSLSAAYVQRNNVLLKRNGIKLHGAYLDVFSVVPLDECYDEEHPVDRRACRRYRAECFDYIRHLWGVVSSEEPADWAVAHLDLVHHAPWPLDPNPACGQPFGIPIPLFNLVYHDAILVPWAIDIRRGGWGCPERDIPFLHAVINAGLPMLDLDASAEDLQRSRILCDLHRRVGCLEMTGHKFRDEDRHVEETQFADGTCVKANQQNGSFEVS